MSATKPVKCSFCDATVLRERARKTIRCETCLGKQKREWYDAHAEARKAAAKARRLADPIGAQLITLAWQVAHPGKMRLYRRRYVRNERKRNDEVIASLPCLDCGMQHSPERRRAILRRMLPCSSQEVHEAWPCIWGEGGHANKSSAGSQMLLRDIKSLGAVRQGDTWYPAAEVRSAA